MYHGMLEHLIGHSYFQYEESHTTIEGLDAPGRLLTYNSMSITLYYEVYTTHTIAHQLLFEKYRSPLSVHLFFFPSHASHCSVIRLLCQVLLLRPSSPVRISHPAPDAPRLLARHEPCSNGVHDPLFQLVDIVGGCDDTQDHQSLTE